MSKTKRTRSKRPKKSKRLRPARPPVHLIRVAELSDDELRAGGVDPTNQHHVSQFIITRN